MHETQKMNLNFKKPRKNYIHKTRHKLLYVAAFSDFIQYKFVLAGYLIKHATSVLLGSSALCNIGHLFPQGISYFYKEDKDN